MNAVASFAKMGVGSMKSFMLLIDNYAVASSFKQKKINVDWQIK